MVRLPNANRWGTVQMPFPVPVNRSFNHDAPVPWFFHTVLAQLAELRSPRCIYNIARTFKASRRSCRPLQNRGRCREWPKTMQRKTEKPHEYSFSEHPCGFMAWSRIRDSNPPPTAWEAVALPDELTLQDCSISVAKCGGFVNSFFCRNAAGGKNLLFAPVAL